MFQPTTTVLSPLDRKYFVILKAEDGMQSQHVLNHEQFEKMHRWYHTAKPSSPYDFHGKDKRYIRTIKKTDVRYLGEYEKREEEPVEMFWICPYGFHHPVDYKGYSSPLDLCKESCRPMFKGMPVAKYMQVLEELGIDVQYNSAKQIINWSPSMAQEVKKWIQKTGYEHKTPTKQEILSKYRTMRSAI